MELLVDLWNELHVHAGTKSYDRDHRGVRAFSRGAPTSGLTANELLGRRRLLDHFKNSPADQ